jgi:hypothetical protein
MSDAVQLSSPLPPEEFVSPEEDEEGDSPD